MHYGHSFKFFDKPVNFCETIQLMLTQSSCNPNQAWEGKGGRAIDYYCFFFGGEGDNHYFLQQLERRHTNAGREGKGGWQSIIL